MAWGLHRSFAFFNTKASNQRMSWSAISETGDVVAMTMWSDQLDESGPFVRYGFLPAFVPDSAWVHKFGNRERMRHIEHALAHLDGYFSPVVVAATKRRDGSPGPNIAWPVPIRMRIVENSFLPTGAFQAISTEPATLPDFRKETWPR